MPYELTGILAEIRPMVERNNFKSKEIWVDVPGEYPQRPKFDVSGGNLAIFDNVPVGSEVKIEFSIRGNENTKDGKTSRFVSLNAFKVAVLNAAKPAPQYAPVKAAEQAQPATHASGYATGQQSDIVDDLPF